MGDGYVLMQSLYPATAHSYSHHKMVCIHLASFTAQLRQQSKN